MPRCKQTGPRFAPLAALNIEGGLTVVAAVSPVVFSHCCGDVYQVMIASFLAVRCASSVSRRNVCRVSAGCTSERGWVVTVCECSRRLVFIERPSPGVTRSGRGGGRGRGLRGDALGCRTGGTGTRALRRPTARAPPRMPRSAPPYGFLLCF